MLPLAIVERETILRNFFQWLPWPERTWDLLVVVHFLLQASNQTTRQLRPSNSIVWPAQVSTRHTWTGFGTCCTANGGRGWTNRTREVTWGCSERTTTKRTTTPSTSTAAATTTTMRRRKNTTICAKRLWWDHSVTWLWVYPACRASLEWWPISFLEVCLIVLRIWYFKFLSSFSWYYKRHVLLS